MMKPLKNPKFLTMNIFFRQIRNGIYKYNFPEICLPEGEYVTISGYIVMTHGSIPEQGEIIKLDNFEFEIISVSDTKIETVKVTKLNHEEKP